MKNAENKQVKNTDVRSTEKKMFFWFMIVSVSIVAIMLGVYLYHHL